MSIPKTRNPIAASRLIGRSGQPSFTNPSGGSWNESDGIQGLIIRNRQVSAQTFYDYDPIDPGETPPVPPPDPPSWSPSDISNIVEWWDAEELVALGDGHVVTENWLGSVHGTIAAPYSGDMGTVKLSAFLGPNALSTVGLVQSNKAADIQDSLIASVFNGTNKQYTVITLGMLLSAVTNNYWSAGNLTATNEYQTCRFLAGTTVANEMTQRFDAGAATVDRATEYQANAPQLIEWTSGVGGVPGAWTFTKDGIVEASFSRSNTGVNAQRVLIGGSATGSAPSINSSQILNAFIICSGPLSSEDAIKLRLWAADRLGMHWKKGLTGGLWTGNSYVYWEDGQSNSALEGRGDPPYEPLTASNAFVFAFDSFLKAADDPVGSNTNNAYSTQVHSGLGSSTPGFSNAFAAAGLMGANDALITCGNPVGGTLASAWATNAATAAPNVGALFGVSKLRMIELMRNLPNPVLLCHAIYQGESNSTSDSLANDWPVSWTTVEDAAVSFVTSMGWTRWKLTLDTLVIILPTVAWTLGPSWSLLRSNQSTFVSGRPRCVSAQSPSTGFTDGTNLHLNTPAQTSLGSLKVAALQSS